MDSVCLCACVRLLSPFVDEFELHGLLLLDAGQQLLEVLALLRDVAVLHLLLLAAVTADQLRPLLGVLRCDVLHLRTAQTHNPRSAAHGPEPSLSPEVIL